jgi:phosphate transport system substrate-binding protein
MIRRSLFRFGVPFVILASLASACGSSSNSSTKGSTAPPGPALSGTINGSGSSFQKAFNDAAIEGFTKLHAGVTINYNPAGSGQGQSDLEGQLVDVAGTDVPVAASDLGKFKGGSILYFPTVSGPITVSYNLAGVSSLQLSATTLAGIFSGTIKKWNDAAIASDNSGATLPATAITIVHRSDSSGTTANFTAFLKAAAGTAWTLGVGKQLTTWPASAQAGKGNPGVAQIVKSTSGAVGYVDYSDAKAGGLTFASIKNAAGKFVPPTLDGASAAMASATVKADLTIDPINAPGDTSYPITSPTYIIVYVKQTNAGKGAVVKAFLQYLLGPDGQALASTVDFAKLPADLAAKALNQVSGITVG